MPDIPRHASKAPRQKGKRRRGPEPGLLRLLTARARVLPGLVIIGGMRCGTTSLYANLICHPCIAPTLRKEMHFFDHNYRRGTRWYRAHFATILYRWWYERLVSRRPLLTIDASAGYLFDPHAPERAAAVLPHAKLVALLRNPVDRAYSHYQASVRKKLEPLSFEEAVAAEPVRLAEELRQHLHDGDFPTMNLRCFSYLARGVYVDQLKAWRAFFPSAQLLILRSEDFRADPSRTLDRVIDYLQLQRWDFGTPRASHVEQYSAMSGETRERLNAFFRPHNQRLEEYLGVDFGWDI